MVGEVFVRFNETMLQSFAFNQSNETDYRVSSASNDDKIFARNETTNEVIG